MLGPSARQWLKSAHLILSVVWLGGAVSMNLLRFAWTPTAAGDLYAVDHAIVVIDRSVVVPAAFGALLTGLLESLFTKWGFFKYRWVTLKWIGTAAIMLYGPLFQAQWAQQLETISRAQGLLSLQDPVYLHLRLLYSLSGLGLIGVLALLSVISTLKPWLRRDRLQHKQGLAAGTANA